MPNYTEFLNLEKPLQSEQYNVDVFNSNCDKIDNFAKSQIVSIATTETAGIVKPDGETITITQDGTISSNVGDDFADKDINNLTTLGNARLQYAPFAINQGTVLNGENNTLTYLGSIITCDPCILTTADGRTKIFDTASTLDISTQADGDYSVFKNYGSGSLLLVDDFKIGKINSWVQPVLSSNGTMGGDSIACSKTSNAVGNAYYAFDDNVATKIYREGTSASSCAFDIVLYIPYGITPTQLDVTNNSDSPALPVRDYKIYGSNDNSNWDELASGTNSNNTLGGTWSITINSSQSYKYLKFNPLTGSLYSGNNYYAQLSNLKWHGYYESNYWLDTSTIPANLKVNGVINNDLVYIGDCTVLNGAVTIISNREFNNAWNWNETPHIVETYINGYSWYRVYSDGWCEQGGRAAGGSTVTLLKAYANTNFSVLTSHLGSDTYACGYQNNSPSRILVYCGVSGGAVQWRTSGYIS